jgi:hypothetical protein
LYGIDVEGLHTPFLVASRRRSHAAIAAEVLAAQPCAMTEAPDASWLVLYGHHWPGGKHTREVVARLTLGDVRPAKPAEAK